MSSSKALPASRGVDAARLTEWLRLGGAHFSRLVVADHDAQRGTFALAPIQAHETVAVIPRRLMISREVAWASEIGRAIDAADVQLRSNLTFLAAFLLQERSVPASFWQPYIAALPRSYEHHPLYFDERTLALLQGSAVLGLIERQRESLRWDYEQLCRCVSGFDRFSLADFRWARAAVGTRVFSLRIYGQETQALVPLADLLNHRVPAETDWFFDDRVDGLVIVARRAFAAGDEVHDSYGLKSNGSLLVTYGFALPENAADTALLTFDLMAEEPGAAAKLRLLGADTYGRFPFAVTREDGGEEASRMFSFLRIVCADGPELAQLLAAGPVEWVAPFTRRNETAVLRRLGAACGAALAGFATTLAEDDALLQDPALPTNVRHCVLVRQGEKRVLAHYAGLVREILPRLASLDDQRGGPPVSESK